MYSEPTGEEIINGAAYSVAFQSTVDPNVRISVQMGEGDSGPFFGPDSDALMQDIVDRLSASPLLTFQSANRNWEVRRDLTPTPPDPAE
jgi:hypothetical protein